MTNHFVNDTFNTFYAESSWVRKLSDQWSLRLEGQFTHQTSVGDERAPGSPFSTWHGSLRVATGERTIAVRTNDGGPESIIIQQIAIPVDRNGQIWINLSRTDARRYISAADILSGLVDRNRLAGRLVLIGTSATALGEVPLNVP